MHTLNREQLEAVCHVEGPLLVLAGAGAGKTRVVTCRIAHLIEKGVPCERIVALTFTNKAAKEMEERVLQTTRKKVLTTTFHSLCARILRESIGVLGFDPRFTIYDQEDSEKVLKECLSDRGVKTEKGDVRKFQSEISHAKNALIRPDAPHGKEETEFFSIYRAYQEKLKSYQALDFDDLLFLTVILFQEHETVLASYQQRWSYILIDEYQDTNAAQYTLIRLLAKEHHNIFAVGDPDQSIYSWRGANIHNILNFQKDFPGAKKLSLEQNYRSSSNILQAANALIAHNESRFEKNLWSDKGEGEKIVFYHAGSDRLEVEFVLKKLWDLKVNRGISFNDCAILYRTHFQSRLFEDYLLKERIPYVIVGGLSFYQRKEIKDILAWLKMILTSHDGIAFERTLHLPKRGIGAATVDKLQLAAQERGMAIFDFCEKIISDQSAFKLSAKAFSGLKEYVDAVLFLRKLHEHRIPLSDLISTLLEKTRYLEFLKEDVETYKERRENVAELVSKASQWQEEEQELSLALFLEELTLKGSHEETQMHEKLRLMTVHNGKGLEFTAVFLVGMEEELFPHINALDDEAAIEEERRLCYVGMTRAKEYLYLSGSSYRYLFGYPKAMRPSRFLSEIPRRS
ncbi:MAG: hypothetical protein RLZZ453_765 [Chlamydiota bacterium]|jgi:DNA helicase-2/ATP-dependent DNA helicase PcrA